MTDVFSAPEFWVGVLALATAVFNVVAARAVRAPLKSLSDQADRNLDVVDSLSETIHKILGSQDAQIKSVKDMVRDHSKAETKRLDKALDTLEKTTGKLVNLIGEYIVEKT